MRENVSANSARLIPEAIASTRVTDRSRDGRLEIFPRGSWKTHRVAASITFPAILIASDFAEEFARTFRYSRANFTIDGCRSIYFCLNRRRIGTCTSEQKRTEFRYREITRLPNDSGIHKTNGLQKVDSLRYWLFTELKRKIELQSRNYDMLRISVISSQNSVSKKFIPYSLIYFLIRDINVLRVFYRSYK